MTKQRIIIDLTEFNNWSGHLTGVQRVVQGLSDGIAGIDTTDVTYVTFNSPKGYFCETTVDMYTPPVVQEDADMSVETTPGSGYKDRAKRIYRRLPLAIRDRITPTHKQFIKRVGKKVYHTIKRQTVAAPAIKLDSSEHEFKSFKATDILISAGRAWDDDKYLAALAELKKNYGLKLAFVVYDLIPVYQQHTFGPGLTDRFSLYLFDILTIADYLFPISKSTEKDLRNYADELGFIDLAKITTFRLGDDLPRAEATRPSVVTTDSFGLCVGTIEARKNHLDIYFAYKLAAQEGIDLPTMYIIGKPGWLTSDAIYFINNDLQVKDKIKILSSVGDRELAWLYQHALYTVYPSQYEGWGLPIAESLAYGTPVIASNTSSMTEIDDKLVDYVSPYDTRALMGKMHVYASKSASEKQRATITKQYKPYSWADSTKALIKQL